MQPIQPRHFEHVDGPSGAKRNGGTGKCKAESNPLSHNTLEALVMQLSQSVNKLKADINGMRKLIANPDAKSRNRKDNSQKGLIKEKFANAAAVQKVL